MDKVEYKDEWLTIRLVEEKPKTKVFLVHSNCSECTIGSIRWFPPWRHYCFFPVADVIGDFLVLSDRCLLTIGEFVKTLNEKHQAALDRKREEKRMASMLK